MPYFRLKNKTNNFKSHATDGT